MNKKSLNKIIILLVFSMIVSLLPVHHPKAEEHLLKTTVEENVIGEALEDELSEENISVENFEITTDELVLETSLENAEGQTTKVTVEVEPGADHITLFTEELNETGDKVLKEYTANIEDIKYEEENEALEAVIEDVETGEIFNYNSEDGVPSLVFLIPIGLAMSPAVLTALFHTGAMIIVGGTAFVIATQANKSKSYYHFAASVKKGGVYIGKGLSKSQAVARIKSKNDTWSTSSNQAKGVASSANKNGKPINEVDKLNGKPKKGYYWHWHPYKRTPKAHAFYGGPVK
ncbi:SAR2788 family putative toxin [Peribacillus sp. NPDC060186]